MNRDRDFFSINRAALLAIQHYTKQKSQCISRDPNITAHYESSHPEHSSSSAHASATHVFFKNIQILDGKISKVD